MKNKINVLFLNENPLPSKFNQGTISAKELRLRNAIDQIDQINVLGFKGDFIQKPGQHSVGSLENKIRIIHLPPCPYYMRALPLFIFGLFYTYKLKPHLIESESPIISGIAAAFLKKITHIPTSIEVRASYHKLIKSKLTLIPFKFKHALLLSTLKFVFNNTDLIIANSKAYQKQIKNISFDSIVINPGLQYLPDKKSRPRKTPFTIGYLGRLVPEKGIDIFINSLSLLPPRTLKKINIEIAGIGPYFNNLKRLVNQLRLNQKVKFLGLSDNYSTISRWQILVNPNTVNHPLEMVNAEAAAMGVPVVCFGNRHIPETVKHNLTGIKVATINPSSLAQTLDHLISHPNQQKKLSKNAPQFAKYNYSFDKQVKKLITAYNSLGIIR